MISPKKIIASILLAIASLHTLPTQAIADSVAFYQALSKTQQQQYTDASKDLELLSLQFQKNGDISNAYRSQATASVVRYNRDLLAEYKEKGFNSASPDWLGFGTCLNSGEKTKEVGCFSASWAKPSTKIRDFGGLIVLSNHLEYFKDSFSIRGILDTVVVPKLQSNELVTNFCKINSGSRKGQQAFALVKYNKKQNKYTRIRQAWYPNFQTKRLQSIKVSSISCTAVEV